MADVADNIRGDSMEAVVDNIREEHHNISWSEISQWRCA